MNYESRIKNIRKETEQELRSVRSLADLEQFRLKYFGRKEGIVNTLLRLLKDLPPKQRRVIGPKTHELKAYLEQKIEAKSRALREAELKAREQKERIDVTAPGTKIPAGHLHPLTQLISKAQDIFTSMGFAIVTGPEVETEYYNFDALNMPKDHPTRDMQDTLWLEVPGLLLRTHMTAVQVRYMEKRTPPFRIIMPGRVFRREATDATHEAQFFQLDGLMVGKDVSLANLKVILELFFQRLLRDPRLHVRFRPSYFPFTEPSVEVDVTCCKCFGKKCVVCGRSGWIESGGAGMVHPQVLRNVRVDPNQWQGFAFGLGLDRIVMITYGIEDIRLLYSGDLRFLKQF